MSTEDCDKILKLTTQTFTLRTTIDALEYQALVNLSILRVNRRAESL